MSSVSVFETDQRLIELRQTSSFVMGAYHIAIHGKNDMEALIVAAQAQAKAIESLNAVLMEHHGLVAEKQRNDLRDRTAELEAKLRTMSELEEQHLAEIDRLVAEKKAQDNYIARLEAMLSPEQLFDAAS